MSSLFVRISIVFFLTLSVMVGVILWVASKNSQTYYLEYTQRLNAPITMYMAEHGGLVRDNQLSYQAISELAKHVEVINPSLEVYLIDNFGNVLTESYTHTDGVRVGAGAPTLKVDLDNIYKFMEGKSVYPILGTNPIKPEQKNIFSVFPLYSDPIPGAEGSIKLGYVYAVFSGDSHQSLIKSISSNYSLKSLFALTALIVIKTVFVGLSLFFLITRRLNYLIESASNWHERVSLSLSNSGQSRPNFSSTVDYSFGLPEERSFLHFLPSWVKFLIPKSIARKDEIDTLADTYQLMATELTRQNANLRAQDEARRMFYASLSHDLRTPLTTMQGYLETLLIKDDGLKPADRKRFVRVAHKQCVKIRDQMVSMFEYSKLRSGSVSLHMEQFSVLELAYDCVHQFSLQAKKANVDISVRAYREKTDGMYVIADIGLLQRVFENLINNAIKNTPSGGYIVLCFYKKTDNKIQLEVCNSGEGFPKPVLDNLYNEHGPLVRMSKNKNAGSGLGLFIVKSIVELHGSFLKIMSVPGIGAKCSFQLSAYFSPS